MPTTVVLRVRVEYRVMNLLNGPIPRRKGEMVDMTATSKPEIPMYHRGKYQTTTPRPVRIVQKESYRGC